MWQLYRDPIHDKSKMIAGTLQLYDIADCTYQEEVIACLDEEGQLGSSIPR